MKVSPAQAQAAKSAGIAIQNACNKLGYICALSGEIACMAYGGTRPPTTIEAVLLMPGVKHKDRPTVDAVKRSIAGMLPPGSSPKYSISPPSTFPAVLTFTDDELPVDLSIAAGFGESDVQPMKIIDGAQYASPEYVLSTRLAAWFKGPKAFIQFQEIEPLLGYLLRTNVQIKNWHLFGYAKILAYCKACPQSASKWKKVGFTSEDPVFTNALAPTPQTPGTPAVQKPVALPGTPAVQKPVALPASPAVQKPVALPPPTASQKPVPPPPPPAVQKPVAPPPTPAVQKPVAPPAPPAVQKPVAPPPTPAVQKPVAPSAPPAVQKPVAPPPTPAAQKPVAPPAPPVVQKPVAPPAPPVVLKPVVPPAPPAVQKPVVPPPPIVKKAVTPPPPAPPVLTKPAVPPPPPVVEKPAVPPPPTVVEKPATSPAPPVVENPTAPPAPPVVKKQITVAHKVITVHNKPVVAPPAPPTPPPSEPASRKSSTSSPAPPPYQASPLPNSSPLPASSDLKPKLVVSTPTTPARVPTPLVSDDTAMLNIPNPTRIQMLFIAAQHTVGMLQSIRLPCAIFGSMACFLYGNTRSPNDIDVLIIPSLDDQRTVEDVKATLVLQDPERFFLINSKDPEAGYRILYYRLPGSDTSQTPATSCKVDLVFPGTLNLPRLAGIHINWDEGLPLIPFSLLLLQKLQGWDHHRKSSDKLKLLKQRTDVEDMKELFDLQILQELKASQPWADEELFSWPFLEESTLRVKALCEEFPEAALAWREVGFAV